MLRSLLVPLDGTRFSERALPLAEGIAQATGASLHLAHVHVPHPPEALLSSPSFVWEGGDLDELDQRDQAGEQAYLDSLADRVRKAASTPVDTALLQGEIMGSLQKYATRVHADAVILSTHSRTGMRKAWMGSVAEALIKAGDLPVLAIHAEEADGRGEPIRVRNVLLPLDGSELSEVIIPHAVELATAFGARVTVLQVVSSQFPDGNGMVPALPQQWTDALDAGEEYLRKVTRRIKARGLQADPVVLAHPRPSQAIIDVAREMEADVIAMATHGYTGVRRALFGSTTEAVLRNAHLPVLIKRPG